MTGNAIVDDRPVIDFSGGRSGSCNKKGKAPGVGQGLSPFTEGTEPPNLPGPCTHFTPPDSPPSWQIGRAWNPCYGTGWIVATSASRPGPWQSTQVSTGRTRSGRHLTAAARGRHRSGRSAPTRYCCCGRRHRPMPSDCSPSRWRSAPSCGRTTSRPPRVCRSRWFPCR